MMFSIKCRDCGQVFEWTTSRKHLCPSCAQKHNSQADRNYRLRHMHPCLDCGKPILSVSTRCGSCSAKQSQSWLKIDYPTGENHPQWKGGRLNQKGYIFVKAPAHPRANKRGYVQEHILVWEKTHNQPLPEGWIIHHLNGIKDDNRPRNLHAMSKHGHSSTILLKEVQKKLRALEAKLAQQKLC